MHLSHKLQHSPVACIQTITNYREKRADTHVFSFPATAAVPHAVRFDADQDVADAVTGIRREGS